MTSISCHCQPHRYGRQRESHHRSKLLRASRTADDVRATLSVQQAFASHARTSMISSRIPHHPCPFSYGLHCTYADPDLVSGGAEQDPASGLAGPYVCRATVAWGPGVSVQKSATAS